ncbi:MAG: hypothetical protein ACTSW1_06675 [Candidatus Hodarchaeales archaeon]
MVPESFTALVELSIVNWNWDTLPTGVDEIWDHLMSQVFLGSIVRTSQAQYIKQLLDPFISYQNASNVNNVGWSDNVISFLEQAENANRNSIGEVSKNAIISGVKKQVADYSLGNTILHSLRFFNRHQISVSKIKSLENNVQSTENLAYLASKEIHNVALTKAVLWLYGCGIAKDLVPPNTHVVNFLNQYSDLGLGWDSSSWPPDWQLFSICRSKVGAMSNSISNDLGKRISPKQVQSAIWYLQTCRGLCGRNNRGKLSPKKLVDFLEHQRWDIKTLEDYIVNIELVEDLIEYLDNFLN